MTEEDLAWKKRFQELAGKAYNKGCYAFTPFLSLAQQEVLAQAAAGFPDVPWDTFGGMEGCERVMARFGSEDWCGYDQPYPIVCLRIQPAAPRFAETLTHRDLLGALMNLGIERDRLGDIVVRETEAWLFAAEPVAPFLCEQMTQARHTQLRVTVADALPEGALYRLERQELLVSSPRLDGVLAQAFKLSREQAQRHIAAGRAFIGGRQCLQDSRLLKEGDVVSLRGAGRFVYQGVVRQTKSGRYSVAIDRYM